MTPDGCDRCFNAPDPLLEGERRLDPRSLKGDLKRVPLQTSFSPEGVPDGGQQTKSPVQVPGTEYATERTS